MCISPCCQGKLCFGRVIENVIKLIFTLNFHIFCTQCTLYKYVLKSIVKISMMFAKYLEYYTIIVRGPFFCGHAVVHVH